MKHTYESSQDQKSEYPFVLTAGYRVGTLFGSERAAANYCQMWNEHGAAMEKLEGIPHTLSRAEYEAACRRLGVEEMEDSDINGRSRYAINNGEFYPCLDDEEIGGYRPEHCQKMRLASWRLLGIVAEQKMERKAQPVHPPKPVELVECSCGHSVPRALAMSASLGTSCPDCYDEMSE